VEETNVSRIFLSHSSRDNRAALALKQWLAQQRPELASEIFLDISDGTGLIVGQRWRDALRRANDRCEAVICLLSRNWEASAECRTEYRTAENLGKQILVARLEDSGDSDITSEWQRCDLFADGPQTEITVSGGAPVKFNTAALRQLRKALEGTGIGPENFVWPPAEDRRRAPYRGWQPFESIDAAVFFGRDAAIVRAMDELRTMRHSGTRSLFVVLGPSGSGKSSFLRAGLIPRLQRDDRRFLTLGIMRPERAALTGDQGLAAAIQSARTALHLNGITLGDIKSACLAGPDQVAELLADVRSAAANRLADADQQGPPPTLVLPLDQAEELLSADAGSQAEQFLSLMAPLMDRVNTGDLGLIVAATIRTDRYEIMQNHPALAGVATSLFDELKPMPATQFKEVVIGPAAQASAGGERLSIAADLVNRLLADAAEGADTLPLLALTLARLYSDYASSGELTLSQYEAMGGMRNVVENAIDEVLAVDPDQRGEQLRLLRSAFVPWLATINADNDQPLRRVARYADLPSESRPLIDALVENRLLVRDERDGHVVVEVALESLLRQWDELAGWLREERQHLKTADDIERNATAWATQEHDPAWLLTGTRLVDAEKLTARAGFADRLAASRDYLTASRDAEDQRLAAEEEHRKAELRNAEEQARNAEERQRAAEAYAADLRRRSRILRVVLAGTAVVALVAAFGFVQATHARHQATREAHDALAAQLDTEAAAVFSRDITGGDDVVAIAKTLAAQRIRSDPAASRSAFYTATAALNTTRNIVSTPAPIASLAVSPDGRILAAGDDAHTIRLWRFTDPAHPAPLGQPLTGHTDVVNSLAFSPDGRTLASGSSDRTVRLWSLSGPSDPKSLGQPLTGHTGAVKSVAFSRDGHTLASGSSDHTVRLWNLADPAQPVPTGVPLTGHTNTVFGLAFSSDGRTLASGSGDSTVRLWNLADPAHPVPLGGPLTGHTDIVFSVAFSPDGRTLAAGSRDNEVRLWNVSEPDNPSPLGHPLSSYSRTSGVFSVAFSPDGRTLASGNRDASIRLWDLTNPDHPAMESRYGHNAAVSSVAFSRDGHTLVSGDRDATVRTWNLDVQPLQGHTGVVRSVAFSPNGHTLASGSIDTTIRLWNLSDPGRPEPLGPPLPGQNVVASVAFSPDGRTLAAGRGDGSIQLWNVTDLGRPAPLGRPLTGHTSIAYSVAFSPDGHTLASGSFDHTIRLWNLTDPAHPSPLGQPLTGHADTVTCVAFSPDGRTLASSSIDHTVRLWNLTDPSHPTSLGPPLSAHTDTVFSVAFSPDGHTLASGSFDHTIRLWNLTDPAHPSPLGQPLTGHADAVESLAFSPDGHTLASGGNDFQVRFWNLTDPAHPSPLGQPLTGHIAAIYSVAFSPDGHTLASGGVDNTVRLWPTPLDATVATLCSKLSSNISQQQWHDWISPTIGYITLCPA
jgi:WD40 repeat protein